MTFVVSVTWFAQFFLAGLPLLWVGGLAVVGVGGVVGAYFLFPHVTTRIDRFLDPASGDSYQVDRSLEAFVNGGLWGRGPGEGTVKQVLPDAHADFVFAVAGEEFGLIACLLIVALFAFIVLRGFARLLQETQSVRPAGGHRALHRVRPAGGHQHGLHPASDADQGHDAALHLLWRLLAAGAGARHGHVAGADRAGAPARAR